jgi:hypothetical protein
MSAATIEPARNDALRTSVQTLRRLADYARPSALDRRILDLGERKDTLTPDERAELLAWVELTQERSVEAAEARVALRGLANVFPELAGQS